MKRRKILVLIPALGLLLTGCSFQEGFATAKHWIGQNIYHPLKDWIDGLMGKKEEPTPEPEPEPTPEPGPGPVDPTVQSVTVNPATLNLNTESADQQLTATVAPSSVSQEVTWSVAQEGEVVSVSETGLVHVLGVGTAVVTATSKEDTSKKGTCNVTVTQYVPGQNDGSKEHPYTVLEALDVYKDLQDKEWSETRVYIEGTVSEYVEATNVYTLAGDATHSLVVYKPTSALEDGVIRPVVGDVALFEGLVENYGGVWELTGNSKDTVEAHKVYPTIQSIVSRGTSTISLDAETSEHATVTYEGSATNASQYSFTVVAASGYQVSKVTFGGEIVEAVEGVYTALVLGNSAIKVETVEEGTVVPVVYKTVAFTPANTKGDTATSSYSGTAVFEVDGFELSCDKFNCNASFGQWDYSKCGHKSTEYDPTITTTSAVDAAIVQIDIKFGTVKEVSGMSAKIRVSTSSTFENATEYNFTPTSDATVEVSLGSGVTNAYYQIFFHCPAAGNSIGNGYIRVDSVTYKVNP